MKNNTVKLTENDKIFRPRGFFVLKEIKNISLENTITFDTR